MTDTATITVPAHYVRPRDPTLVRIVQVDPPGPELTASWQPPDLGRYDGDPKWEVFSRPGRVDGQEYVGQGLHSRSIELVFDGWAQGPRGRHVSVEPRCRIVHSWSIPVGGHGSGNWPPRLRIEYGPWQQQLWRVAKLRWGVPLFIDGDRIRQSVQIDLAEWTSLDLLLSPVERAADDDPADPTTGGRTYTVVAGDSLYSIAADQLHDANRWREIGDLNGLRDPWIIHPGQVLQLPAS